MRTRPYTWEPAPEHIIKFTAKLIKETRLARDLNPEQAAEQAGVKRATFYRWEAGHIGSSTCRIIWWLMKSMPNGVHDPAYWRERALHAEEALAAIDRRMNQYQESHREITDNIDRRY